MARARLLSSPGGFKHLITVATRTEADAGTDGNVYITFLNSRGVRTGPPKMALERAGENLFEPRYAFPIKNRVEPPGISKLMVTTLDDISNDLKYMLLDLESAGTVGSDWLLESISGWWPLGGA